MHLFVSTIISAIKFPVAVRGLNSRLQEITSLRHKFNYEEML